MTEDTLICLANAPENRLNFVWFEGLEKKMVEGSKTKKLEVPLAKAMVISRLLPGQTGPALKVVGGDVPDESHRYSASWGACNSDFQDASDSDKLSMLLANIIYLIIKEKLDPKEVHEAHLVIPEYKKFMSEFFHSY